MFTSTIGKLSSAAVAAGIASVALAAPASAMIYRAPGGPSGTTVVNTPPPPDPGWQVAQVATGAAGGIALTGAGAAVVIGVRRHHKQVANPT
jgi:hypothetical protein